jgi:hypothetical protein
MALFICTGHWVDTTERFDQMVVSDCEWDGIEDAKDEQIFFYTDGDAVVGDHGDFIVESAEVWE